MQKIRATIYFIGIVPLTIFYVLISLLIFVLPFQTRFKIISGWARCNLWWLNITCGLSYRVHGEENIPEGPAIIMSNHQSTWETLALQLIFPAQVWVIKRELLWLPIFGWGLATLKPIAIDRSSGRKAVLQVVEQGMERLNKGIWVTIFPEGTRVVPRVKRRFGKSGGVLAERSGSSVVPVAHNAGMFWPRNSFLKKPGVIDIVIGPPIESEGKSSVQITEEVRQWIEPRVEQLIKEME